MIRQIARQQYLRQAFTQSSSSLSSSILSPISFIRPSASFLSDSRVLFSTDAHGTDTTQRTTTSTGASYLNASNSNSPTSPAGIKKTSEEEREEYNAAQQTTESQAYADAEAMVGTPEAGQEWQEFKDSGMEFIYEDDSHIDEDVLKHMEESLEAVLNHSVRRKRQFPADLVDQTRELALKNMIKNYHEFEDHVMGTDRMKGSLLGFAHFIALDECIPMMQERQDDIQDVIHCLCPDTPRLHDQLLHKEFPQASTLIDRGITESPDGRSLVIALQHSFMNTSKEAFVTNHTIMDDNGWHNPFDPEQTDVGFTNITAEEEAEWDN